jgi:hypothetical protein
MFEIHATVSTNDIESFKKDCLFFDCKPVLIELQNNTNSYQQLMTSQKFNHTNWDVEINKTLNFFNSKYDVVRIKVEINPYVDIKTPVKYYETHFRIISSNKRNKELDNIIREFGFHKSINIFKKLNDDEYYQMATYRSYELNLSLFENKINEFKRVLTLAEFFFDKIEVEACVIDTNDELDAVWLNRIN